MIDLKDLKKLSDFCHRQGIVRLTTDNLAVEFGEKPVSRYKRLKGADNAEAPPKTKPQYTDEDYMYWSALGIPGEEAAGG